MENSSFLNQIEATNKVNLSGFYDNRTRSLNLLQNSLSSVGFDGYVPSVTQELYLYDKYNGRFNILPGQYILVTNDSYQDTGAEEDAEFCQVIEVRTAIRTTQFLGSQIQDSIISGYDQYGNELDFIPEEEVIIITDSGVNTTLVRDTDYEYLEGDEGQSIKILTEIDPQATITIYPETTKKYYGSLEPYQTDESFPIFVLDENGDLVLDDQDNPIPVLDEEGNQTFEVAEQPESEFSATVYIDYVNRYGLIKSLKFSPEQDTSLFPTHKIIISREIWSNENISFNYFYSDLDENVLSGEDQSGSAMVFIPGQEIVTRIRAGEEEVLTLDTDYEYVTEEEGLSILLIGEQVSGDRYIISTPYQFSKSLGSRGWHLSSEGNAILNNIAVRGRVEALEGNFEGYLTVADGSMRIGRSVSEGENQNNNGIFIDPYNFWYDDGSFRAGSVNNYLNWDSNTLNIKGNITAGTIGSNWKISANKIEAGNGADYVALSTSVNGQLVRADFEEALVKNLIVDRQDINGLFYTTVYIRVEFADLIELMKSVLPDEFEGYDSLTSQQKIVLLEQQISQYFLDKTFIFKNDENKINLPDTEFNPYLSALANRYLKIDRASIYKAELNENNQAVYTNQIIEDNIVFQFSGEDYLFDANGTEDVTLWTDEVISLPSEINFKVIHRSVLDNIVTITTDVSHGFSIGDIVTVSRIDAKFNGTYRVLSVPTTETFTFEKFSIDVPINVDEINGLVSKNNGSYLIWAGDPQPDLAPFSVESSGNVNISDLFTSNQIDVITLIKTGGLKINGYQMFVSNTQPAVAANGDVWIKNLSGPELYKYNGTSWIGGGMDLTGYATESYVTDAISDLVDTAPSTLNTLNELAAALGDDENFASTVTTALGTKAPLSSPTFTGNVTIGEAITKTTSTAITSSSATTIATFPITGVVAAECIVLISSTSNGSYYASKVLITADPYVNAEADITEYAINSTKDFDLFPVITATISGENLLLRASVSSFVATTAKVVSTSILGPLGAS
jgi:hypothetical protein